MRRRREEVESWTCPDDLNRCHRQPIAETVEDADAGHARVEEGARGAEMEVAHQPVELGSLVLDADVMTEAMVPRHRRPRLPRVELPGVQVEHDGMMLATI